MINNFIENIDKYFQANNCGENLVKDSSVIQTLQEIIKGFNDKNKAFELFEHNLLWIKGFGIILIVILAIVNYQKNKNLGLIKSAPFKFLGESTIYALSGVLTYLLLVVLRNN